MINDSTLDMDHAYEIGLLCWRPLSQKSPGFAAIILIRLHFATWPITSRRSLHLTEVEAKTACPSLANWVKVLATAS